MLFNLRAARGLGRVVVGTVVAQSWVVLAGGLHLLIVRCRTVMKTRLVVLTTGGLWSSSWSNKQSARLRHLHSWSSKDMGIGANATDSIAMIIVQRGSRTPLVPLNVLSALPFRWFLLNFNRVWPWVHFLLLLIASSNLAHARISSDTNIDFAGRQFSILIIDGIHRVEADAVLAHDWFATIIWRHNVIHLCNPQMIWDQPSILFFVFACNTFRMSIIIAIASWVARILLLLPLALLIVAAEKYLVGVGTEITCGYYLVLRGLHHLLIICW